jgi:hypothetical protein
MLTVVQIISVTCDNASNNDTMVEALKDLLEVFPGESNRTRCFDHIVNLIARSIIRQFDLPKASSDESTDDALQELRELAEDIEKEELDTREGEQSEGDDIDDDNTDGWVDEREEMSEMEVKVLDEDVQPIRQVLVKVSLAANNIDGVYTDRLASSARQLTRSKIRQPSSYPAGMPCLMNST